MISKLLIFLLKSLLIPQFFDFQTMKHSLSMSVPASITSILLHRENGLVAVTCDDLTVRVVDIETRRVVRELSGFRGTILDLVRV